MPADLYAEYSEFYDLYVGHRAADLPLYREYALKADTPVLEIGAGSGRLTVPLAEAGVSVVAVDISPSMLALLESRMAGLPTEVSERISVVEADACDLDLDARFDLVMVPFYTFNYFLTAASQKAALRTFHTHLSEKGTLLVDVSIPWGDIRSGAGEPVALFDKVEPRTGNRVQGRRRYEIDTDTRIDRRTMTFTITPPEGPVTTKEFVVTRRYFLPEELSEMFGAAGFEMRQVMAGYAGAPAAEESEQLMYVLGKN